MARKSIAQAEIPGTESEDRDPELHALGLEIKDLEQRRMELTRQEKAKREEAAAALKARRKKEYDVDGVHMWIEPGSPKLKVKLGDQGEPEEVEGEDEQD